MDDYSENDEPGFLRKYRIVIGAGVVLLLVGITALVVVLLSSQPAAHRKAEKITMVKLLPPPPLSPPPPPPPMPPPPPPKMIEQTPVNKPEPKPEDKPKDVAKSPERPPGPQGPATSGPGDAFGLPGGGGGGVSLGGGEGGSRWGWYAGGVQAKLREALGNDPKTRDANIRRLTVRIWADSTGRIVRVVPVGSTGDVTVDQALKSEVFANIAIGVPPNGMPMPIVLRISAERPQ